MPKMKTNKSAAKRFKRTKNGKIKRSKAYARHLAQSKTAKQKRGLRKSAILTPDDAGRMKYLLPYGS